MATVGEQLTAPESGWKRYDDRNTNITYIGTAWATDSVSGEYDTTATYIPQGTSVAIINASSVRFNFTGTSVRFIHSKYSQHSKTISYKIDGQLVGTADLYNSTMIRQILALEKTGLVNKEHFVEIYSGDGIRFDFDAIDIDETGELKPYAPIVAPINLTATAGDSQVTLSWAAVDGATSYIVKRSTTSGGTYETIASGVTDTSYVDTSVTNGTTYYYVVVAVNADGESNNSNEASATPVDSSKVLLVITMSEEVQKEYELSKIELDAFIDWYNTRAEGTGLVYYIFSKDFNLGPFDSRKDYIVFDKIENFEVMEFTK